MTISNVPVITARIPNFIRDTYPAFAQFVEDYFNWLEYDPAHDPYALPGATPNFLAILNNWEKNLDPEDYNVSPANDNDAYLNALLNDMGFILQRQIAIPKSMLLTYLRDFYLSRGSVQSFQMLFKILFGDSLVTITYPREEMLWLDAANYGQTHYIFTKLDSTITSNPNFTYILENAALLGGTATGSQSKVQAFIEAIDVVHYPQSDALRIQIFLPTQEFLPGDSIRIEVNGYVINSLLLSVVIPTVDATGTGYMENDIVSITSSNPGTEFYSGYILVEHTSLGSIQAVSVANSGLGYRVGDAVRAKPTSTGSGANFSAYVKSVGPNGEISEVTVYDPGYGFDQIPQLYVVKQQPLPAPTPIVLSPNIPASFGQTGEFVSSEMQTLKFTKWYPYQPAFYLYNTGETATVYLNGYWADTKVYVGENAVAYITVSNTNAWLIPITDDIGQIKKLNIVSPYLILGNDVTTLSASVSSVNGTGVTFSFGVQTRFTTSSWVDQKGFLEINSVLTDDNKYQQFSYELTSTEDPLLYNDIVDDLLHPVGYKRFAVTEKQGFASIQVSANDVTKYVQPIVVGTVFTSFATPPNVQYDSISEANDIWIQDFNGNRFNLITQSGDFIKKD